ncbi:MAG: ATP-binding cassette domain-containing protein [Paraburkholderia sp.]|uniref:AAA family ATPase n=1 Tax=Paraburkholderia sp. TaxID=1926495 RepID=UPI0011FE5A24|nr:AAA family ATPase [Paraburkholderia sp.]TAL99600.1 MAG: ATP-binding cassette domain-containing protein [Paraburkholderia sp.]TAM28253.1 MAG: ATP-binding cassette domain-containing protein [Paraburkholderia sp.]
MTFNFTIPTSGNPHLTISLKAGENIFILGANGTGKSSLMQKFYSAHHGKAQRISAHRQTWFASASINLSPAQKRNTENNILNSDVNAESRWKDDYAAHRANIAIYDLIDAENIRARNIATAVDCNNIDLAKTLSKKDAPIKIINELLRLSNIPIEISVKANEQVLASKSGSAPYSVAELSDGERNALLIAASVLTVPTGTLLLIDEPERHLHRSIISPLLTLLFAKRRDCAFVVSTHDVMLPLDNPHARTLLIRGCTYNGSTVTSWDADLVPSESNIDEELKKDILGSRRTLLFIEGQEDSLDLPLYSLIFPNVTVIAKSSCRDVDHAVSGIRGATELHWLRAFGVVDDDRRTLADAARLKEKGVYAVSVYAVESIYYHPEVQKKLAIRHASVTGENAESLIQAAKTAALAAAASHVQRLSERAVEKTLRDELDKQWPKRAEISAGIPINITIDVAATVNQEVAVFNRAIAEEDLEKIIARYPVRETPMLTEITRKLGFQTRDQYEGAVRRLLIDDAATLEFLKSLFGSLVADLAST